MEYVFFAGANGSGKSTLIKNMRSLDEYQGFEYICADEIEKSLQDISDKNERMRNARDMALMLRKELLLDGMNVMFESVASHKSHIEDLKEIKELGYEITTIYVTTDDPNINIERIKHRGRDNDTYLTPERVKGRYERSLGLLSEFIKLSDTVIAVDNSINYVAVFSKTKKGVHCLLNEKEWAEKFIVEKLQEDGIRILKPSDLDEKSLKELLNRVSSIIKPNKEVAATLADKYRMTQDYQDSVAKYGKKTTERLLSQTTKNMTAQGKAKSPKAKAPKSSSNSSGK
ncbi:MAG: zeta toxin family protein [Christensenellales bacterium]